MVSLDEFVDSILGSFDEELEAPDTVLDVLMHGSLDRFVLDPRLTARAVQNLLRNAMRYCERRIQIASESIRKVASCGSMTTASAFPSWIGSGFSSRSTAWTAVAIVPPVVWPGPGYQPAGAGSPGRHIDRRAIASGRGALPSWLPTVAC